MLCVCVPAWTLCGDMCVWIIQNMWFCNLCFPPNNISWTFMIVCLRAYFGIFLLLKFTMKMPWLLEDSSLCQQQIYGAKNLDPPDMERSVHLHDPLSRSKCTTASFISSVWRFVSLWKVTCKSPHFVFRIWENVFSSHVCVSVYENMSLLGDFFPPTFKSHRN